jgi:hypothetical protein
MKEVKNINKILDIKVEGGGDNIVDMSIKDKETLIVFSIKFKNKYSETDVSKIDHTIKQQNITSDYKIGLIVKDKDIIINHKYTNNSNIDKQIHDTIIKNKLIFDKKDLIKALYIFCERFSNNKLSTNELIEFINKDYLLSPRKVLVKKLHQQMTLLKFINNFLRKKDNKYCICHKPRSGKSITILLICKYLLENGYDKLIIMTSVPATIKSFIDDLDDYIDFKDINYKLQGNIDTIDSSFHGIAFCSVQYLKTDKTGKKKELLKKIAFDGIIIDESHKGSSTNKTKTEILDIDMNIESIRKNIKLNIFASGTADKTKKYYKINNSSIDEWEIEDEGYMKKINTDDSEKENIISIMCKRHGNIFKDCLENKILNQDYTKHPTQILMKHSIDQSLKDKINNYNSKNGTKFGYSCSSLFALKQKINHKGEIEYLEEFEICKDNDGVDILESFLKSIISNDRMDKNTIMKMIEQTQTNYNSRLSTIKNPMLFIMYLPTHTGNNTISLLQKTLKNFIKTHLLWNDYNIEYSNSIHDTGDKKEEYNDFIKTIMNNKKNKRKEDVFYY